MSPAHSVQRTACTPRRAARASWRWSPYGNAMKMILLAAWSLVDSLSGVHSGRAGQVTVHVPRIDSTLTIDGTLSAPQWKRAALLTGFSQYKPVDGIAAEDSTQVLVWYAKDAIYFGIRAFELHGAP